MQAYYADKLRLSESDMRILMVNAATWAEQERVNVDRLFWSQLIWQKLAALKFC